MCKKKTPGSFVGRIHNVVNRKLRIPTEGEQLLHGPARMPTNYRMIISKYRVSHPLHR